MKFYIKLLLFIAAVVGIGFVITGIHYGDGEKVAQGYLLAFLTLAPLVIWELSDEEIL